MPRKMPALALTFRSEADRALELAKEGETARARLTTGPGHGGVIKLHSLELLYELAFLRIFLAWEVFLEESFLRYLCGYYGGHGQETTISGSYAGDISAARAILYGHRDYLLWHSPNAVVRRAQAHFVSSRHELVIASIAGRLEHLAQIRHRVAHSQKHARIQFDHASMALSGQRYKGSRPGRFLRDWAPGRSIPTRWVAAIADELSGIAFQITP